MFLFHVSMVVSSSFAFIWKRIVSAIRVDWAWFVDFIIKMNIIYVSAVVVGSLFLICGQPKKKLSIRSFSLIHASAPDVHPFFFKTKHKRYPFSCHLILLDISIIRTDWLPHRLLNDKIMIMIIIFETNITFIYVYIE